MLRDNQNKSHNISHNKSRVSNDRWVVSYADLLTLLFCFFVVMYSLSSIDVLKYQTLSDSLQDQLGEDSAQESAEDGVLVEDKFTHDLLTQAESQIEEIASDVEAEFQEFIDDEQIQVSRNKFWLEIEFKSSLLYPSGSSQLLAGARPMLISLARRLEPMDNRINIEGFTDNRPISTAIFPSNWELSSARAATVVRLFEDFGVNPERMASIGYGEHRPVADNNNPEGQARNRRVVVVVMAAIDGNPRMYEFDQLSPENLNLSLAQ